MLITIPHLKFSPHRKNSKFITTLQFCYKKEIMVYVEGACVMQLYAYLIALRAYEMHTHSHMLNTH